MKILNAVVSLLVREQGISEINMPEKMIETYKIVPAPKELFVE